MSHPHHWPDKPHWQRTVRVGRQILRRHEEDRSGMTKDSTSLRCAVASERTNRTIAAVKKEHDITWAEIWAGHPAEAALRQMHPGWLESEEAAAWHDAPEDSRASTVRRRRRKPRRPRSRRSRRRCFLQRPPSDMAFRARPHRPRRGCRLQLSTRPHRLPWQHGQLLHQSRCRQADCRHR